MSLQVENSPAFGFRSILRTISGLSPYDSEISLLFAIVCVFSSYKSWKKKKSLISQYLLPYSVFAFFAHLAILSKSILLTEYSIVAEALFGYTSLACASWLLLIVIDMFLVFKSEKFSTGSENLHEHRSFMFRIYYFHSFLLLPIILPIITTKSLYLEKLNAVAFVYYLVIRALALSLYSLFAVFITLYKYSAGKRDHALLVRNIVIFITATMYVWSVSVLIIGYSSKIASNCWVSGACSPQLCALILRSFKFQILCSLLRIENIFIILGMRVIGKYCERVRGSPRKNICMMSDSNQNWTTQSNRECSK